MRMRHALRGVGLSLAGLALLPVVVGLGRALVRLVAGLGPVTGDQAWFLYGLAGYVMLQAVGFKPMRTYVLGHELTHAVATLAFGGRVRRMRVGEASGHVDVTKTNLVVTLAPYVVPLYAVLAILLYMAARPWTAWPYLHGTFLAVLGAALGFHLMLTWHSLTVRQPDLAVYGLVFSLIVIALGNLLVAALLLKLVFPAGVSLRMFFFDGARASGAGYLWIWEAFSTMIAAKGGGS